MSEAPRTSRSSWGAEVGFEIRTGPRGPSALWDGRQLTSTYDPVREAEVWAAGRTVAPEALVFVAGDPWGLASQALAARGCRTAALLPGPEARPWVPPGIDAWDPASGPLEEFFSDVLDRWGPDGVAWEVWPAFERQAPGTALDWGRRFRDVYRTVQGSWLTYRRFGARFWRNALRNAVDWETPKALIPGDRPIVVAASGPSLDDGLEVLARNRNRFDLWALPSSFETLVSRGLPPDAGVATDGGFYAREHLQRLAGTGIPVLAALGSAPDPVLAASPCLFFSQGLAVEQALLAGLTGRYTEVPSQGTVAVTALRLALGATTGPVFVAGLDLSFRDYRGHTSPHTVDRRFSALHQRLQPAESLWATRTFEQAPQRLDGVRTSAAMLTYARWFRSRGRFERPVIRIAPSALRWDTMQEASWTEAQEVWARCPGQRTVRWGTPGRWPDRAGRKVLVRQSLKALVAKVRETDPQEPWLIEAARTAVPGALAEDLSDRRAGRAGTRAREALVGFLESLTGDLE